MDYVLAISMIQGVSSLFVLVGVVICILREKPIDADEAERAMMRSRSWPTESRSSPVQISKEQTRDEPQDPLPEEI